MSASCFKIWIYDKLYGRFPLCKKEKEENSEVWHPVTADWSCWHQNLRAEDSFGASWGWSAGVQTLYFCKGGSRAPEKGCEMAKDVPPLSAKVRVPLHPRLHALICTSHSRIMGCRVALSNCLRCLSFHNSRVRSPGRGRSRPETLTNASCLFLLSGVDGHRRTRMITFIELQILLPYIWPHF